MNEELDALKKRYNSEKLHWIEGITYWLICFNALQILGLFFKRIIWVNVGLGIIILFLVLKGKKKLQKEIKEKENNGK